MAARTSSSFPLHALIPSPTKPSRHWQATSAGKAGQLREAYWGGDSGWGVGRGQCSGHTLHTVAVGIPALRKVLADPEANYTYTIIATVCRWEDDRVGSRAIGQPAHEADVKAQL